MNKELLLPISAVFSPRIQEHTPPFELWRGLPDPHYDKPEIAKLIHKGLIHLANEGALEIVEPTQRNIKSIICETHTTTYVEYLEWLSAYLSTQPEMIVPKITSIPNMEVEVKRYPAFAFPSIFPRERNVRESKKRLIDLGLFANDTGTPVMANTYEIASLSAATAITGADLIISGKKVVYCGSRPPGHHAEEDRMSGYCYFNNAAIAAQRIYNKTKGKIAILDIDIHHGNGTQQIFYRSNKIDYYSLHIETEGVAPNFGGYEEEVGVDAGIGHNHNYPLRNGFTDKEYFHKFEQVMDKINNIRPDYLILSLGFDGHVNDPLHIGSLTTEAYVQMGRKINELQIPLLIAQEGGYNLENLDDYLVSFLKTLVISYEK